MPLSVRMLGPLSVSPLSERFSRKGGWVLALLALRPGREVDRAFLAGTLWPETSESQALYDLRRELSRLRRALGDEAERVRSVGTQAITLDPAGAEVDLWTFDEALGRGDLERAVEVYAGPLLEGCTEDWAVEAREARAQAYLGALEALAARDLERADAASAARRLRLAIKADPLREGAQRALMRALAAGGAHAAATQTYRELRLLLERELEAEPDPETRALYRQLRAAAQVRAAAVTMGDPGRVPHPPLVTMGDAERVPQTPPAPPVPVGGIGHVPRPLTPLVGRAAEVREIRARVGASRLITLTGSGGVGKSRLAMQVASDLAGDFPDGAWFVELAPLSDPALVVPAVTSALGVHEAPGRPLGDLLVASLRGRELFLVLDNCEHVLDAASRLADRLLTACAGLRILATSRQSLGLTGEVAWRVPSLVVAEAVALFQERAAEHGDPDTIAQICQRLDGIPLAIELAAARTRVISVAQIAERLDDRFRLLTGGSRSALPRHRTLKAAVDWGYQLLTEEEQALLRGLSVFAGGFALEAAEAVFGGDVLDPLENLVDKSLVTFSRRYRLLETVRQYASARLAERGETERARARHLDWFVSLAEEAEPHIFGGDGDRGWIQRLEEENDNLRAAFDHCQTGDGSGELASPNPYSRGVSGGSPKAGDDDRRAEAALRLAAALHWFWFARGHLREGRDRMTAALSRAARAPGIVRARALAAAGYLAMWVGDYAAMAAPLTESLGLARDLGDARLSAYALCGLGAAATGRGDTATARPLFAEAVDLARAQDDGMLLVFALYWQGTAEHGDGDLRAARASLDEGLLLARRLGNRPGIGHTLFRIGEVAESAGDHEDARRYHLESLGTLEESTDRWGIAQVLDALGRIEVTTGRPCRGARLLGATEALCELIGAQVLPSERGRYHGAVAAARTALGEPAFAAAWTEGRALRLEQAVAYARGC